MSTDVRAWQAEFRVADAGERIIEGVAVPYNDPTEIYERGALFWEQFAPGAFSQSIAKRGSRVPLLLHHDDRQLPVGKTVELVEAPEALRVVARVSDTAAGNDALTLVHDGVLDGLSVGFYSLGERWNTERTERTVTRAELRELSLVNFPAYDNARVLAVRSAQHDPDEDDTEVLSDDTAGLVGVRLQLLRAELVGRQLLSTPGIHAGA